MKIANAQNKLHFTVTGKTAAELIVERAENQASKYEPNRLVGVFLETELPV